MLILNAQVKQRGIADVRMDAGYISAIGTLQQSADETVIDASGGALLPGLHDHHIHLAALAAKQASVICGPPQVADNASLAAVLQQPGKDWLRGIGYHESVAGSLNISLLDQLAPHRPLRIQHRSGRMWYINSIGLDILLANATPPPGLEREAGCFTGRLFDEDDWLKLALKSHPPSFDETSKQLATYGITGLTDMSPANDATMAAHFGAEQAAGALRQACLLAGSLALADERLGPRLQLGSAKLHLHENALPDIYDTAAFIRAAHRQQRSVAIHCTTEVELVYALHVLESAGVVYGDRIEHVGIAPDHLLAEMARLKLWAVSQPHFIAERGDQYARDVEPRNLPFLYRLRALVNAGIPLAAGSDAPFGSPDPWASMAAAVSRTTAGGLCLGGSEALTPDQALAMWLADPHDLTQQRKIAVGAPADLCLLDRPWEAARSCLSANNVRASIAAGRIIYNRIDQSPL
jgi:predicted amidohydrolase YtcJ